jgi:hypothetical protein
MDQQPPQDAPVPAAPPATGWNQPPAAPATTGWVQPSAAAARGPVTGFAKIGAVVLVVNGILWTLFWGAIVLLGAAAKGSLDSLGGGTALGDSIGGAIAAVGIFFLVIAVLELIVGVASWMGKEWARIGGIVYALLFGGVLLLSGLSALGAGNSTGTNTAASALVILAFAIAYIYTLVVFAVRWRGRATL